MLGSGSDYAGEGRGTCFLFIFFYLFLFVSSFFSFFFFACCVALARLWNAPGMKLLSDDGYSVDF